MVRRIRYDFPRKWDQDVVDCASGQKSIALRQHQISCGCSRRAERILAEKVSSTADKTLTADLALLCLSLELEALPWILNVAKVFTLRFWERILVLQEHFLIE